MQINPERGDGRTPLERHLEANRDCRIAMRRLLCLALMLVTPVTQAKAQAHRADAPTIARLVDALASRAMADRIAPALGVAITMDGRTIYSRAFGMADASAGIPAHDRTLWYLASTSKSFTGFAISLLADRGALRFDAPIQSLLPGVAFNPEVHADSLTLANFLSHTHHIDDNAVVTSAAYTGEIPEKEWPSLIKLAGRERTNDLIYSNFGYNVAAMVIDRLRPEGWRAFLEKNVFLPAGMPETYSRVSGIDPKRIARPHGIDANGRYYTEPFFKTDRTMNSAGGQLATLHDLARWTIVQMDSGRIDGKQVFPASAVALSHRLIARQTREQAKRFAYFDREGWGAGWDVGSYNGEPMISRFGGYGETRSHLSFLPNRRIGAVVMSTGGPSILTDVIAAYAYDLEAGRAYAQDSANARLAALKKRVDGAGRARAAFDSVRAERQAHPLNHPIASFAGTYEAPGYGRIAFAEHGGKLDYRWGAVYGPVEIYDASKDQMRIEIVGSGSVVSFDFPQAGPATSLSLQGVKFNRVH
jgi:CubicO group peptidase (beta-lactamase class C family)